MSDMTSPSNDIEHSADEHERQTSKAGRIAVAALVLSILAFWAWALGPYGPRGNPDDLDDVTYGPAAASICSAALAELEELEPAAAADDPVDRADTLVEANTILRGMVAELNTLVDPAGTEHDALILEKWLSDWEIFLGDRDDHVDRLRTEGDVAFQVSRVERNSVSGRIEWFARVNQMIECGPPLDL